MSSSPARLLALGMELPEEAFVNIHGFDSRGETYGECPSSTVIQSALTEVSPLPPVRFMK